MLAGKGGEARLQTPLGNPAQLSPFDAHLAELDARVVHKVLDNARQKNPPVRFPATTARFAPVALGRVLGRPKCAK